MESISEEKKTAKTIFVFTPNREDDEIKLVRKKYFVLLIASDSNYCSLCVIPKNRGEVINVKSGYLIFL